MTSAVNQHPQMSVADLQIITNVLRIQPFHFTQQEDFPLLEREGAEAVVKRAADVAGFDDAFQVLKRADPVPVRGKQSVKRSVHRIVRFFALQRAPKFAHSVMQDTEEPRSDLRSPLEPVERGKEHGEDILYKVFRF